MFKVLQKTKKTLKQMTGLAANVKTRTGHISSQKRIKL